MDPNKTIKEEVLEANANSPPPEHSGHRRSKGLKSPESPVGSSPPPCTSGTPPSSLLSSPTSTAPGNTSPPATRPSLNKLKRFLSTLVQFGTEISPELGEKVRTLVLGLANGSTTVEEFHNTLQDITNFPLRPFVLPFLRTHLPLLQRELAAQARIAKQTVSQFLRQHEQMVLDPSCSPSEPSEIFHSDNPADGKRKHTESIYENGIGKEETGEPVAKRERLYPHSQTMPLLFNPLAPLTSLHPGLGQYSGLLSGGIPLLGGLGSLPQSAPPPHLLPVGDFAGQPKDDRAADEEWKNINTMLNCILSMVEKTKRALSILQSRDRGMASESDLKRAANDIIRITEDRIGEIKRRAEEAVAEVKRQAMVELERLLTRNGKVREEEEPSSEQNTTSHHQNLCWNCGRKAQETCSGCNVARYCGALCQHRDWENHHQLCCTLDRRQSAIGTSLRLEDRRQHISEERRSTAEERRNFSDEQTMRRHSVDENKRLIDTGNKEEKRADKEKEGENREKEKRGLPTLSSQLLSIDNIRRMKNHATEENSQQSLSNLGFSSSLRANRCLRTTPPVSASSVPIDK